MALKHRIFIYGTLKKGFPNHDRYMGSAKKIGNYQIKEYRLEEAEKYKPGNKK